MRRVMLAAVAVVMGLAVTGPFIADAETTQKYLMSDECAPPPGDKSIDQEFLGSWCKIGEFEIHCTAEQIPRRSDLVRGDNIKYKIGCFISVTREKSEFGGGILFLKSGKWKYEDGLNGDGLCGIPKIEADDKDISGKSPSKIADAIFSAKHSVTMGFIFKGWPYCSVAKPRLGVADLAVAKAKAEQLYREIAEAAKGWPSKF